MIIWNSWGNNNKNLNSLFLKNTNKEKIIILSPQESEIFNFDFSLLLNDNPVEVIMGGYDVEYYKKYLNLDKCPSVKLHLWPNYFMYEVINRNYISLTKLEKNKNFKYLFTNMNGIARPHRVYLMDLLVSNNLLDSNCYSWHESFSERTEPYKPKYWDWQVNKLEENDNGHAPPTDGKPMQYNFPKVMDNSFLNLVTETNTVCPFITEKTFKNFLYNKPFLIYGSVRVHSYLKSIGFKLHEDFIDYSFDTEEDDNKRGKMIVEELVKLSKQNLNNLYKLAIPVLEHNQSHMINLAKEKFQIPEIIKDLNYHTEFLQRTDERLKELL